MTVNNEYTPTKGLFSIKKVVVGTEGNDGAGKQFTVEANCTGPHLAQPKKLSFTVGDDTTIPSEELPVGTSCEISEDQTQVAIDGYNFVDVAFSTKPVVVTKTPQVVIVTNTYAKPKLGNLSLSKVVTGATVLDGKTFSVTANCTNALTGEKVTETLTVKPGTPVSLANPLPLGSTCTFAEDKDSAALTGYEFLGGKFSVENVTIGTTETAVTLENSYGVAKLPKDKPKQPKEDPKQPLPPKVMPKPKPQLPKTGVSADAVFVAAGLAAAGGLLLILRRKQSEQ